MKHRHVRPALREHQRLGFAVGFLGFPQAPGDALNRFPATVSEIVYQGDSYLLYAALEDGTQLALRDVVRRDTIAGLPEPGARVALGLHARDTVVIPGGEV